MNEATIVLSKPRRKVRANTRRMLHSARAIVDKERKAAEKQARRSAQSSRSEEYSLRAPFKGCDPERTLALLGDAY